MAVSLVYMPIMTFRDVNDVPIPFAQVFSYQAGTTTPLALHADPAGTAPLPNPAICDATGRLTAYMTVGVAYKLNVLDANDVQVPGWPIDNIQVSPSSSPSLIASPEPTVAISDTVTDPGEPGTESLATSEQGMWERIKFVIREMKGTGSWRTTTVQRERQGTLVTNGEDVSPGWPDGTTSTFAFTFRVPYDYHSGPMSFTIARRVLAGSGTAIMPYLILRIRDGATAVTISSGNINFAPGDTVTHLTSLSIAAGQFAAGDWIKIPVNRTGGDAGDTNAGTIAFDGHVFVYTGFASR